MNAIRLSVTCLLVIAAAAHAGRTSGPASKVFVVQGFKNHAVKVSYKPDQPASVQVIGDGDSPLAVAVFDADGGRVALDAKNTDRFLLRWTPAGGKPYTVKIYNRGGVPARFQLKTN